MNPPKGYYRNLLKDFDPEIRLAFTHTPIVNCVLINNAEVIKHLEKSSDPHAKFYVEKLKLKKIVAIKEGKNDQTYWKPGELYFKS